MSITCTKIEVIIDDTNMANYLVDSLENNEDWYAEDGFASYDFSGIYHAGDVFAVERNAPVEFVIKESEDTLGMQFDLPKRFDEVVPFLKKLNDWYLKQLYDDEGTVFFDLLIEQLEKSADGVGSMSIVYEELDTSETPQSFRGKFSFAGGQESYSESSDLKQNSLSSDYALYL